MPPMRYFSPCSSLFSPRIQEMSVKPPSRNHSLLLRSNAHCPIHVLCSAPSAQSPALHSRPSTRSVRCSAARTSSPSLAAAALSVCMTMSWPGSAYLLHLRGLWEVHVVDCIDHVLSGDHASAEPPAVETSNSVLAALDTVKFDVDFAIVVVECKADVNDLAILLVTFALDVFLELVLPVRVSLSVN